MLTGSHLRLYHDKKLPSLCSRFTAHPPLGYYVRHCSESMVADRCASSRMSMVPEDGARLLCRRGELRPDLDYHQGWFDLLQTFLPISTQCESRHLCGYCNTHNGSISGLGSAEKPLLHSDRRCPLWRSSSVHAGYARSWRYVCYSRKSFLLEPKRIPAVHNTSHERIASLSLYVDANSQLSPWSSTTFDA